MHFKLKSIGTHNILYVMAVDAEYGEHLTKCFKPLFVGVGPVEAAISLTRALSELECNNSKPDLVVSLGSAGSCTLNQTEVYQASSVCYRDMDASLLGFEKGLTPYLDLSAVLELNHQLPDVPSATLSSGAKVISGIDFEQIDADMVDMETFALKRVCQTFNLPLIALRGISDGDEELEGHHTWTQYLHIIDEKLAIIVTQLEDNITKDKLDF